MSEEDLRALVQALQQQNAVLTKAIAALAEARPRVAGITVAALYAEFERGCKHLHSWRTMEIKLAHAVRRLGEMEAVDLTPQAWQRHRQVRRTELVERGGTKGRPPSELSLNVELSETKAMLEWGVANGFLEHNPLRPAKAEKTRKRRKTWLREEDLALLLASPEPRGDEQRAALRAWVLVQADTGLRFTEARRIRRDRLRYIDGSPVVDIDRTKGGKSHVVALTPRVLEALEGLPRALRSPYWFTRPASGQVYGGNTMYGWFRDACRAAGLDSIVVEGELRVRPHDLRRSAATNAHNRGADLLDVQALLNHSSPATTALYVQHSEKSVLRVAEVMTEGAKREAARKAPHSADSVKAQEGSEKILPRTTAQKVSGHE